MPGGPTDGNPNTNSRTENRLWQSLADSMLPFFPSAIEEHPLMALLQDLEQRKASVCQDVHLDVSNGHKVCAYGAPDYAVLDGVTAVCPLCRPTSGGKPHRMSSHSSMVVVSVVQVSVCSSRASVGHGAPTRNMIQ